MCNMTTFLINEIQENPNLSAGALTAHVVHKMKPKPNLRSLFWKVEKMLDGLVEQGKVKKVGNTYKT